jgi:Kef-type K+ transport system membrane component KefB
VSEIDFSGLLIVAAVAFSAPLLLGLAPTLRLPAVVLELVAGIAIGPSGFGWVELDEPVEVLLRRGEPPSSSPATADAASRPSFS